jgi:farnesyl-diphosphate farnesyltransferase
VRLEALDALVQVLELAHGEGEEVPSLAGDFSKIHCPNLNEAALLQKADALVACFAQMQPALRGEVLAVMRTIAGGQRGDLVRFGYASAAAPQALPRGQDTVAYTYAVAGCVGEFWTRICAIQTPGFARIPVQHLVELGRLFGQGLQLVNILRDLPEDLRMGRCYLPSEELSALGLSVSELFNNPKKVRPVFEHWLGQAEAWLEAGEAYGKGIRGRRLRFSVALPRLLGQETLALLRRYPSLETPHRVRVTRSVVLKCALKASMN